jgi:pimeloyl-ACP methyl ester carboxylesterase
MSIKGFSLAMAGAISVLMSATAFAAPPAPEFVQFRPSATKGALYRPDPAAFPDAHIGVVVMHRNSNFMSHLSTTELSNRGFYVLGMNPRCDNNEAACAPWENNALDVKQGVEYLRGIEGITHVVLLGHSGGGPTMSFYQAVAEAGPAFCQDTAKLSPCGDGFEDLPKADALILMDAHPGNTINALRSINGSVTNDAEIMASNAAPVIDPTLDPFLPENGYVDEGSITYSPEFIERYTAAQGRRMNTLIDIAQARLAESKANGQGSDGAFVVPMGDGARLMDGDTSIHASTEKPQKLLLNDGTIVSDKPVQSVRVRSMDSDGAYGWDSTMFLTLRSFLSVRAIRGTDSMNDIDWCSSNNSTPCNVAEVSVPLLVLGMGGHYFVRDNEQIFEAAASADKDYVVVDGATHNGAPCKPCEAKEGDYSNATKNLFDYMATWANERF